MTRYLFLASLFLILFSFIGLFFGQKSYALSPYKYDCADASWYNDPNNATLRNLQNGGYGSCNGRDMPPAQIDCSTTLDPNSVRTGNQCADKLQTYYNDSRSDAYTPSITAQCQNRCVTNTTSCDHPSGTSQNCLSSACYVQGFNIDSYFCVLYATPTPTPVPPTATPTPVPPTATPTPTPIPTYTITGNVFVDKNRNGAVDSGEGPLVNASVSLSGTAAGLTSTNTGGNYSFSSLSAGNYTVTLTVPFGYEKTTTNPVNSQSLPPNKTTQIV